MITTRPLNIGSLSIPFPFVLAPMAGYTDGPFRSLCSEYGAGAVYTEVVNAQGITRKSGPTMHLLEVAENEHTVAAHLYGNDPMIMAQAAERAEQTGRFKFIDINCGCPVRKIVRKGCGAALMKDPAKIGEIVKAVRNAVSLPVTVKTRLGFDPEHMNISDIARHVEDAGASAIAVHARTADQGHTGPAQWEMLAMLRQQVGIPVIGNGGVKSAEAAITALNSGVDAVMIATGAVGCPWIFRQIKEILSGLPPFIPSFDERKEIILKHLTALLRLKELESRHRRRSVSHQAAAVLHFRAHLYRYLKGTPGFHKVRANLQHLISVESVIEAIEMARS